MTTIKKEKQSSSAKASADKPKTSRENDVENNKGVVAFSYIWILFLIPLLTKKKSEFAQFHAKQGLVLFALEVLGMLFMWVPLLGQLFMLALLVISVMGIVKTLNGEWWEIPYIYEWSRKIKL
ncbi:MAG: hypothetical protein PHT51_00120 [Patescibacteria group bacterium]|nr:hypothetical protein [Patescibacteria group bacterium]MDD4610639.1 hypothetical protein [Patescibacteria group bacterium]